MEETLITRLIVEDGETAALQRIVEARIAYNNTLAAGGEEVEALAAAAGKLQSSMSGEIPTLREVQQLLDAQAAAARSAAIGMAAMREELIKQAAAAETAAKASTGAAEANNAEAASSEKVAVTSNAVAGAEIKRAAATESASRATLTSNERMMLMSASMAAGERPIGGVITGLAAMAGGSFLATTAVLGLSIGLEKVTASAMDWAHRLVLIQNNTGAASETMKMVGQDMLTVSTDLGASLDQMATGAERVLDYGYKGADAINVLNEATRLAVATGADAGQMAAATGQALHQYGADANEAAKYLGILYEASLSGSATVGEFTENLKRSMGLAASVGVPLEQVAAAAATLTREYGNATEANTALVNVMRRIVDPTQEEADAWDALAKKTGDAALSSENIMHLLSSEGLTGVIQHLQQAYHDLGLTQEEEARATFNLINGQRGGIPFLLLVGKHTQEYSDILAQATDRSKAQKDIQEALNRELDTGQAKWDKLGASIKSATASGSAWDKAAGNVADGFRALGAQIGNLWDYMSAKNPEDMNRALERLGMSLEQLDAADAEAAASLRVLGDEEDAATRHMNDLNGSLQSQKETLERQKIAADRAAQAQKELGMQTGLLKKAFDELGDIKAAGATQSMVQQMTNSLNQLQKVFAEKGTDAAAEYAQGLLDRFAALPPETKGAIEPIMLILQDFIDTAGKYGYEGGSAWGEHLHAGLADWQKDIQDMLDQYSTAADMRDLFRQLGIETGDNYAQNITDRVAAWFEPYKQQLVKYLEAAKITAEGVISQIRDMAQKVAPIVHAMEGIPGVGKFVSDFEQGLINQAVDRAQDPIRAAQAAIDQLNSLKAQVDKQASAAIDEHNAKQANKGKGGGTDPAHAAVTEESRLKKVQDDLNTIASLEAEKKLREEKDNLSKAQDNLNAVTTTWNGLLKGEQDLMKNMAHDHKEGMAGIESEIKRVSGALNDMRATHEQVIHDMDDKLYGYDQQLKQLEKDAEHALAPLRDAAEAAADAVSNLQEETAKQDRVFTHAREAIQDESRAFEEQAAAIMGPLDEAYKLAQKNVEDITVKYQNRLFPIEQELLKLQQEEQKLDRGKKLADEAQEVGNLQARLAAALPGSREYYQLLKMRDEASGKLGRDVRIDQLTTEKEKIEQQRDVELKRAQDNLRMAKEQRDAEAELLDKQREAIKMRLEALNREQELYDRQQRDKIQAAEDDKKRADDALKDEEKKWSDKKKIIEENRALIQELADDYKHNAAEQERTLGLTLTGLEAEKKKRDDNYNAWVDQEKDRLDAMQDNADRAIAIAQGNVDALQKLLAGDEKSKDDMDFANRLSKAYAQLALDIDKANLPIKIKGVGTETATAAGQMASAAQNTALLSQNLQTLLAPALQQLGTDTGTGLTNVSKEWDKVFAVSGTSDPKNIPNKLFKHSDEGFFTNMDNKTRIAMDFSKGVWNGKLQELSSTVIDGNLVPMATQAGLKAQDVGASMDSGVAKGIDDNKGVIGDALIRAIDDAMNRAKTHIESSSPSKKAAREIGLPTMQGIAMGYEQGRTLVGDSLRNILNDTFMRVHPQPVNTVPGSSFSAGGINLSLSLPNVTKLPTDPNEYRNAAGAMMEAMRYEAKRRGLKDFVLQP